MQLKDHHLWWKGPQWLLAEPDQWPEQPTRLCETVPAEEREICNLATVTSTTFAEPVVPTNQFSDFARLKRVTAWILRFINNLCTVVSQRCLSPHLTVSELSAAEGYWLMIVQSESFPKKSMP